MTTQKGSKIQKHFKYRTSTIKYNTSSTTSLITEQNLTDPSDTATLHNRSEFSDLTITNTQSVTITTDSNVIQIHIHSKTPNTNNELCTFPFEENTLTLRHAL